MRYRTAAFTDIGQVRRRNEDRYLLDDALGLYGIADGIGGLPGGAEAAECAVVSIMRQMRAAPPGGIPDLGLIVRNVNAEVRSLAREFSPELGLGTTLTFGLVHDDTMNLAHVGDSRCYVWHKNALEMLSRDHNVENEILQRRERGESAFFYPANRNALTRCIGQEHAPEADLLSRKIIPGERYLFCSDGITRLVKDSEIREFLGNAAEPLATLHELVDLANQRGGFDNATAVLLLAEPD